MNDRIHKTIIIVLGMHRCGTSSITRALKVLGVSLGSRLMPPAGDNNSKGFFEDIDFNEINIEILRILGHEWHSLKPVSRLEFSNPQLAPLKLRAVEMVREKMEALDLFAVKDPRMARTMPFWEEVFQHLGYEYKFVVAVRNPANAARSLAKRDSFDLVKGYLLWQEHMVLSLKYSNHKPRVIVDYDNLMQNAPREVARIAAALNLIFDANSSELKHFYDEFLASSLTHHALTRSDLVLDPELPAQTLELSNLLFALADDSITDEQKIYQEIESHYVKTFANEKIFNLLTRFDKKNFELASYIDSLEGNLVEVKAEAAELKTSQNAANQKVVEVDAALKATVAELGATTSSISILQSELKAAIQNAETAAVALLESGAVIDAKNSEIHHLHLELQRGLSLKTVVKNRVKQKLRRLKYQRMVSSQTTRRKLIESGLFDASYYAAHNRDVRDANLDLFEHYLNHGWLEGRDPSSAFVTDLYLEAHPDVRTNGLNPLIHYVRFGHKEGRAIYNHKKVAYHIPLKKTRIEQATSFIGLISKNPELVQRFIREARTAGIRQALRMTAEKLKTVGQRNFYSQSSEFEGTKADLEYITYKVVPFYLDPYKSFTDQPSPGSIAVHLHLFYADMIPQCVSYLKNIPYGFDLYISTPQSSDVEMIRESFSTSLPYVQQIVIERTPNRGRDIAPLIIEFGKLLSNYDFIAHFHTKKSPHRATLNGWFDALMETLCGTPSGIMQIFNLLKSDAKVVYPAGNLMPVWDTGWSDNKDIAKELLAKYSNLSVDDYPYVEFPQGTMFWAKTSSISGLLSLPLSYGDFPEEPIAADATLAHALERLILIYTTAHPGRNYRLESPGLSKESDAYYEAQLDYSETIAHDTIKVMAYFLPQFNPNPLNDEWHGKGFTEWHKVRSAQPLFHGHYQQHIPHDDTGYYLLDTSAQLRIQAEQLKKSGVHGFIFYHYWFSGTLILEQPAQMLLREADIAIPFCFCWANENWTRRWDGNEQEILLGQVYSPDDARSFILYLIPFFKDPRYVTMDGRPILYVYRPSAMEYVDEYMSVWREECSLAGVPDPYVIATMTRGATAPQDYGMDAAVERVLQDWTGGAVENIKDQLRPYGPINGSILDYNAVADHYMEKPIDTDYVFFRSLVPTWDNTARYGSEAFALHGFSVHTFQKWMEHLIDYSERTLPANNRFVIVNAWNEWAEGAHLEPDQRFGYGYLNAIGRALSNHSYTSINHVKIPKSLHIKLQLNHEVIHRLENEPENSARFFTALANSTIFQLCSVSAYDAATGNLARDQVPFTSTTDENYTGSLTLVFNDLYLVTSTCLETMTKMALKFEGFNVSASVRNVANYIDDIDGNGNFDIHHSKRSGLEIGPFRQGAGYKVCTQASCFLLQKAEKSVGEVSVIIRFHKSGNRQLLDNALFSLLSQNGSQPRPYLALQDFDNSQIAQLEKELSLLPWADGCEPVIESYTSSPEQPDLRSLMLNDMLKKVPKGFTAYLDYDDVLFPQAYLTLIKQIQKSNKNATFSRVYSTQVDAQTGMLISRSDTYDYGYSYEEFLDVNHAPLHSFLLDLAKIDVDAIRYFPEMKYMEDYYMTLQIFTRDETDWQSLRGSKFIGDYIHRVGDLNNTLAISDAIERQKLTSSEGFMLSESRIAELRDALKRSLS
jgi:lipopolysaccharide biosynthesis protein